MVPLADRKLGRRPSVDDPRTLRLSSYMPAEIKPQPVSCLWQTGIDDWGIMGNDRYGNCVIVTAAHMLLAWSANEMRNFTRLTDQQVIELSRVMGALDGYSILERLKYWRKTGMFKNYLWAFAAVDLVNELEVKDAINAFGGCDVGVNLPRAWQDAEIWDVGTGRSFQPGSWGGHSVPIVGYDSHFLYVVTWGEVVPMTWAALHYYCDEAYALIDSTWLADGAFSPSGYNLESLHCDLNKLTR